MTDRRTVAVSGVGRTPAVPDVMRLEVGVAVVEPNVSAAIERAGTSLQAVLDALVAAGIPRADLSTSALSVYPQHRAGDDPGIAGYEVTSMLTVTVRDLDAAGSMLTAAAEAGGDDLRVHNVALTVDDPSGPLKAARDAAFADARERADQYARLCGATLGPVLEISEGSSGPGPSPRMVGLAAAMPVEAGEQQVTVAVNVVFELV
ncbi:SIMPL domain-containing protein [Gordonia sp. (in: high G+C Gram-positive bacteria)]|uniref:SIMPL domain-containing protein n=1 Tax=Gordonia sp. (in: high G+C Gram-positive bacteria) TaxID=84139 RepID=UPI001695BFCE|nr:SIMPL domain-containing protein [Gordonia sp. (in: high G+C Gram-positive bacteria)]NLG45055.1 SIMPL domain-containing protein [Gordonia sp. (in: high G+C Gram-positive bacteria)]